MTHMTPEQALKILNHEIYASPAEVGQAQKMAREVLKQQAEYELWLEQFVFSRKYHHLEDETTQQIYKLNIAQRFTEEQLKDFIVKLDYVKESDEE